MTGEPDMWQRWERYRPSKTLWLWSGVTCVAATLAIGFTVGGWVTSRTATQMAAAAAEDARNKLAAAVCVSRFESSPDASTQLEKLKKTSLWDRDYFIQKGGWVTMPGSKEPVRGASDLCVQQLMTTVMSPQTAPSNSS